LCFAGASAFYIHLRNVDRQLLTSLRTVKTPLPVPPDFAIHVAIAPTPVNGPRKPLDLEWADGSIVSRNLRTALQAVSVRNARLLRSSSGPGELDAAPSPVSELIQTNNLLVEESRSREISTSHGHGWSPWVECKTSIPSGYAIALVGFNVLGSRQCGKGADCEVVERSRRTIRCRFRVRLSEEAGPREVLEWDVGPDGRRTATVLSTPGTSVGVITAFYKRSTSH